MIDACYVLKLFTVNPLLIPISLYPLKLNTMITQKGFYPKRTTENCIKKGLKNINQL